MLSTRSNAVCSRRNHLRPKRCSPWGAALGGRRAGGAAPGAGSSQARSWGAADGPAPKNRAEQLGGVGPPPESQSQQATGDTRPLISACRKMNEQRCQCRCPAWKSVVVGWGRVSRSCSIWGRRRACPTDLTLSLLVSSGSYCREWAHLSEAS